MFDSLLLCEAVESVSPGATHVGTDLIPLVTFHLDVITMNFSSCDEKKLAEHIF